MALASIRSHAARSNDSASTTTQAGLRADPVASPGRGAVISSPRRSGGATAAAPDSRAGPNHCRRRRAPHRAKVAGTLATTDLSAQVCVSDDRFRVAHRASSFMSRSQDGSRFAGASAARMSAISPLRQSSSVRTRSRVSFPCRRRRRQAFRHPARAGPATTRAPPGTSRSACPHDQRKSPGSRRRRGAPRPCEPPPPRSSARRSAAPRRPPCRRHRSSDPATPPTQTRHPNRAAMEARRGARPNG